MKTYHNRHYCDRHHCIHSYIHMYVAVRQRRVIVMMIAMKAMTNRTCKSHVCPMARSSLCCLYKNVCK